MSFCSLETGGGDYLAGGVDNPCSSGIFLATPYMRELSAALSALQRSTWTVLSPVLSMRFFSCLLLDPSGYFFTQLVVNAGDAFRNCTKVRTVHIVRSVHKLNQKLE